MDIDLEIGDVGEGAAEFFAGFSSGAVGKKKDDGDGFGCITLVMVIVLLILIATCT